MRELGVGIVGWGFMGRMHAHAVRSIPLYYADLPFLPKLAGICSRDGAKAARAAAELGVPFSTGDYRELIRREGVEVVSVCAPNGLHEAIAIEALRAGKQLYIDKPLSTDAASAARIVRCAEGMGAAAQVAFHNRFYPAILRAKRFVAEGGLGRLTGFSCRYLHSGSVSPSRPFGWKHGPEGGVLLDLGSHALDLIAWLIGRPESGLCELRTLYPSRPSTGGEARSDLMEDHALILLRMPCGALGTVEASKIATGAGDELLLELRGDRGACSWSLMRADYLNVFDESVPEGPLGGQRGFTRIECGGRYEPPGGAFLPSKNAIGWERAHVHSYYSFLDALVRGAAPEPSLRDGLYVQELTDRLRESSESGEWVRLLK